VYVCAGIPTHVGRRCLPVNAVGAHRRRRRCHSATVNSQRPVRRENQNVFGRGDDDVGDSNRYNEQNANNNYIV